jgi:ribosomal protein L37AE/L43A
MAFTFTGLKLQGSLGRFGKTSTSDIEGYAELPDGKVSEHACGSSVTRTVSRWKQAYLKSTMCSRTVHENSYCNSECPEHLIFLLQTIS